ncbi:MAG: glycosyltransferase family A protein [Ferruginibacter sp.]
MHLPTVNILLPTYNQSTVVDLAIKSALMQDYPNLVVIISDDSTDNKTESLVTKYEGDNRIRYYRNRPGLGKTGNYRKLLYEYADGEWVVNLDGDDHYTDKTFISTAIRSINAAGGENVLFYMASQVMAFPHRDKLLQPSLPDEETVLPAADYFYKIFSIMHFSHLSTLYNAALARQSGFYEKDIMSSDMHSFYRLCLRNNSSKVILSKKIVGRWVQHGGNESSDHSLKTHVKNSGYYFSIVRFAMKNKTASPAKNMAWLARSLFLYWGSYVKRIFIKRK